MKFYKRYETLLKLVVTKGLGWAQTNEFGPTGKSHLLHMRREGLVVYESGDRLGKRGLYARGTDLNAYFYTITPKGLNLLLNINPGHEDVLDACESFIRGVFEKDFWIKEYKYRT